MGGGDCTRDLLLGKEASCYSTTPTMSWGCWTRTSTGSFKESEATVTQIPSFYFEDHATVWQQRLGCQPKSAETSMGLVAA